MERPTLFARSLALIALLGAGAAQAQVAPECASELAGGVEAMVPDGDIEAFNARQSAIMLNHPALTLVVSPLGSPKVRGAEVGLEVMQLPALGCSERVVVFGGQLKTEDTNKMPVIPRPRLRVALPKLAGFGGYLGVVYVPPVPIGTTQTHHAGFELGLSRDLDNSLTVGLRYHAAVSKVVDDIAHAVEEDGPVVLDFYANGLWGADLQVGYEGGFLPAGLALFTAGGFTNVGTFFLVGDDNVIQQNVNPFQGFAYSLGGQFDARNLMVVLEWHHAVGSTMGAVRSRFAYRF